MFRTIFSFALISALFLSPFVSVSAMERHDYPEPTTPTEELQMVYLYGLNIVDILEDKGISEDEVYDLLDAMIDGIEDLQHQTNIDLLLDLLQQIEALLELLEDLSIDDPIFDTTLDLTNSTIWITLELLGLEEPYIGFISTQYAEVKDTIVLHGNFDNSEDAEVYLRKKNTQSWEELTPESARYERITFKVPTRLNDGPVASDVEAGEYELAVLVGDDRSNVLPFHVIERVNEDIALVVSNSPNNPEPTEFVVSEFDTSEWYDVFVFEMEAEEESIVVQELPFTVRILDADGSGGDDFEEVVADIQIQAAQADYNNWFAKNPSDDVTEVEFDFSDGVFDMVADREIDVTVRMRFHSLLGAYPEGTRIKVEMTSENVDEISAELIVGGENLDEEQLQGSAYGEEHTLVSDGFILEFESWEAESEVFDGPNNDIGYFEFEFDITASGEDIYISTDIIDSMVFSILDGAGVEVSDVVTSLSLRTSVIPEDEHFIIEDGSREWFTFSVEIMPQAADSYSMQFEGINHTGGFEQALPENIWQTDYIFLD